MIIIFITFSLVANQNFPMTGSCSMNQKLIILLGFKFHPPDEEIMRRRNLTLISLSNKLTKLISTTSEFSIYALNTRPLRSHHMDFNFRNHVAENSVSKVDSKQLSHHLHFCSRNHVAENPFEKVEVEQVSVHYMISNYRNHVAENIFAMNVLLLLQSSHWSSDSRNHVAENISFGVKYPLPTYENHVAENTLQGKNLNYYQVISCLRTPEIMLCCRKSFSIGRISTTTKSLFDL